MVVARAPIERVAAFAREKGWTQVRLLSAGHSSFRRDHGGDTPDLESQPIMTVFKRDLNGTIRLHWASELLFEPTDPAQDPRHLGTVEPLWTLFDLTRTGGRPRTSRLTTRAAIETAHSTRGTSYERVRSERSAATART